MRWLFNFSGIFTVVLCIGSSSASAGVSLYFGGNIGTYTIPKEISGYIDGNSSPYNKYMWTESSVDQNGNVKKTYKYNHPVPLKILPNAGISIGTSIIFPSRIGIFFEGCRSSSILDKKIDRNDPVMLPGNSYSMVPHDYQTRTVESNDYLYIKSSQFDFGLSYFIPINNKLKLIIAGSYGRAYFSHYFRIETKSITTNYYQNNGHLVFSDVNNQGSFDAFGIRYYGICLKPAVAFEWNFKHPLSMKAGLAYPVSRIEKGEYFSKDDFFNYNSHTYYPSRRFWAGNVLLNAAISIKFGKGDKL